MADDPTGNTPFRIQLRCLWTLRCKLGRVNEVQHLVLKLPVIILESGPAQPV